jgi:hypothetical protein
MSEKYIKINTFKSIVFDENTKPLVICDIDYTLLGCSVPMDKIYKFIKSDCEFLEIEESNLKNAAIDWRNIAYYNMGFIKQTDPGGFSEMVNTIERLGGKLIFLTARGELAHDLTIQQFINVGIQNPEKYEFYYTNNEISKGEYIKKYELLQHYHHITFIDDYLINLFSVSELFPQINCYLFETS